MRFTKRFPTGRYASPDGPVDIPATRVKHWSEQFGRMKAAGLKVPVAWGHVSTALPKTQAEADKQEFESTKYNAGYVEEIKQAPNGDLEFVFDVETDAAAKLGTSIKDASPLILPEFRDGAGNAWNDVIGHFALCKQGVIAGQSEFQPVAANSQPALACGLALSLSGKHKKAVRLAMPFDKDTDDQDDVDGVRTETATADDDPETGDGIELNDMGAGNGEQTKTQLLQLLDSAGLPIGDYSDESDLVEKLIVALNVKKSHNEHDSAQQQQSAAPDKPLVVADGAPVAMSLEQVKSNPVTLALFNHIETNEKATLAGRLAKCLSSGRCTPAIKVKLQPAMDGFRLSLGADGKPQATALHAQIELLESLPAGAAWEPGEKAQRLGLQEVTPPAEATAIDPNDPNVARNPDGSAMTPEQYQATVDRLSGRRFAKSGK